MSVGFAGRDYGFFIDLGERAVGDELRDSAEIAFLLNYKDIEDQSGVGSRARSHDGVQINGFKYKHRVPAVVGHTYALRSIGSRQSDVLVAFSVVRRDGDGSLVIFWKMIEAFADPAAKAGTKAAQL